MTMGLTKKGTNASEVTQERASEYQKGDLDSSDMSYVVLIQGLLFLISLFLMLR
jgi:hypothetical protein